MSNKLQTYMFINKAHGSKLSLWTCYAISRM